MTFTFVLTAIFTASLFLVSIKRMRRQWRSQSSAALLVLTLSLLSGCNSGGASPQAQDGTTKESAASQVQETSTGFEGQKLCPLLSDDEIRAAIGPHDAGISDLNNLWGLQSCRWMATTVKKDGWKDSIEVALFRKDRESWAREQAEGEPVQGFVDGARYNSSSGDLWFNCARDRFCVVKARLASGKKREPVARQVAQLIVERLR